MNSGLQANSTQKQTQGSAATTSRPDQAKGNLDSAAASGDGEAGHFRRWWNEYQKKMKSAFQVTPLELQTRVEQ